LKETPLNKYIHTLASRFLAAIIILLLVCESFSYSNNSIATISANQTQAEPITTLCINEVSNSEDFNKSKPSNLYAKYAAVIDGTNYRVLFEKDGFSPAANASTTKIMTIMIALEYGNLDQLATVSKYAATMPDVQLNINTGERYVLRDLLYSLMLQSHNDSAVAIAENVALTYLIDLQNIGETTLDSMNYTMSTFDPNTDFSTIDLATISTEQSKEIVHIFATLMNLKATTFGCTNTYFITPNGLDAEDENGKHSTTAVDLARIMAHCVQNQDFLKITQTKSYSFTNQKAKDDGTFSAGSRSFTVNNANAFLQMMDGVISGKTGFTGDAGYCYVCALKRDDNIFISVVLACGWPGNKSYKWADTKKLLNFGIENYFDTNVFTYISDYKDIAVNKGITPTIKTYINSDVAMLLSRFDNVNIIYSLPETINAPVIANSTVGTASIYINDELYCEFPIIAKSGSEKINFGYCLDKIIKGFLP